MARKRARNTKSTRDTKPFLCLLCFLCSFRLHHLVDGIVFFVIALILFTLEVAIDRACGDTEQARGHVLIAASVMERDVDCFSFQLTQRCPDPER
jgi:hypothetical protein